MTAHAAELPDRKVDDLTLAPAAKCGKGTLDGSCWRPGDPRKHLSVPGTLIWARIDPVRRFATRCGLGPDDGTWLRPERGENDDDYWCLACLADAGITCEMWDDDD